MTPTERQSAVLELLRRSAAIAVEVEAIEELKLKLRAVAAAQGSFTERVPDHGSVEVKAPRKAAFKGQMPTLVAELYLALDDDEKKRLVEAGIVAITELWGRPFYGSVTVQPALTGAQGSPQAVGGAA